MEALLKESQVLIDKGVPVFDRLRISPNCPLILPSHIALDKAREQARGAKAIGTTGRGIGPAYEDKVARRALRVADLFDPAQLASKLRDSLDFHNFMLAGLYRQPTVDYQQTLDALLAQGEHVKPLVVDVTHELAALARKRGQCAVRRRPGRDARCGPRHLSLCDFVKHHRRWRVHRHRPRAALLRLCAGHREGLRNARGRGAVSDRAV